jgi:hexosaminidase
MTAQRRRYRLLGLAGGSGPAARERPPGTSRRRSSLDLDLCDPGGGLVLEAPPPGRGLVKVAIHRPCWVWRGVDLGGVRRIEIGAVQLPFTYRMGSRSPIVHLPRPRTATGEIELRLDRPGGFLLGSLPLRGFTASRARNVFDAAVDGVAGVHDLYLVVTGADIDSRIPARPPLTIVDWVDLRYRL